ncbi:MAG: choice-of-anchor Q domain-containing protein [Paracoccaceae bacterium]|nr:choice-of-anchor Q domain-containing protein [Paracoccaceae bacterium]
MVETPGLVVTTLADTVADDGETSLREAIAFANSDADASAISFDQSLSGQTIILSGSELVLSSEVTIDGDIDGDDVADITVSGDDASRVFNVAGGAATLDALTITNGYASAGGGVFVESGATLDLTNSTITGSRAYESYQGSYEGSGRGLYNCGTSTLTNSTISENSTSYGGRGGGLAVAYGATLDLSNSTISGNSASFGGGLENYGTVALTNSTISGNNAYYGGGLRNLDTATLTNITISGNYANNGGGFSNTGTATLTNSTISGNSAYNSGGGIYNYGTATLTNSIVLGNDANSNAEVAGSVTSITSLTSGVASDVFAALDSSGGGLLTDNGGSVQTIALKADALNPTIDAGTDASAPLTDARGLGRVDLNFINNGGTADLGAFEIQDQFLFAPTITSGSALSAAENQTIAGVVVATDDKPGLVFSITGGVDAALFTIDGSNGTLLFKSAPNFEVPGDAGGDNVHDIVVTVTDSDGLTAVQSATIRVSGITDTIFGADGDDLIRGTDLGDDIDGLGGNDLITGLSGDDTIRGGQGVDIIRGGADDDLLMGGSGKDRIFGEGGSDNIEGGAGNDRLLGLSGNDTVRGDEGDDLVSGGGGNDLVLGGDGDDRLRGGRDSDTLLAGEGKDRLQGGTGNDRLFGQAGNDKLTGAGGADELFGGNGIDRLYGRRGNDELTGGEGVDRFFFNLGDGSDTITDFEQGMDFIRINKGADVFSDLTISQVGDDALITFGNVRILALDEDADDFTSSDFIL